MPQHPAADPVSRLMIAGVPPLILLSVVNEAEPSFHYPPLAADHVGADRNVDGPVLHPVPTGLEGQVEMVQQLSGLFQAHVTFPPSEQRV
jgi:hypothetical protein